MWCARVRSCPPEKPVHPNVVISCLLAHSTARRIFGLFPEPLIATARSGIETDSPLVRAMAVWAFGRLATAAEIQATGLRFAPEERDAAVLEEWKTAFAVPAER